MVLVGSPTEIAFAIISGLVGTLALGAAVQGWLLRQASWPERGVLLIAALCLIKPGWITDLIGLGLLIVVAGIQYMRLKK